MAELARVVIEHPNWIQKTANDSDLAAGFCFLMGLGYQFSGDPVRALDSYELLISKQPVKRFDDGIVVFRSLALDQRGCLAEAERCARAALAQPDLVEDQGMVGWAMTALGVVLLHQGLSEQGAIWLGDDRVDDFFIFIAPCELGWAAVRRGDVVAAQMYADKLHSDASDIKRTERFVLADGWVALLRGAVAGQVGDEDQAGELLSGALVPTSRAKPT